MKIMKHSQGCRSIVINVYLMPSTKPGLSLHLAEILLPYSGSEKAVETVGIKAGI